MSRDDWYRGDEWDEAARRAFSARLARARPSSRAQYRRIKAAYLLAATDPAKRAAGRDLLAEVLADPGILHYERVTALSMLGKYARADGRLEDAERSLRASLELIAISESGSSDLEEVWLADVLMRLGGQERIAEAQQLLAKRAASPPLLLDARFEMCVVGVRVAAAAGDEVRAARWAESALELAAARHSGLANHPALGLVEADAATVRWLRAVAGRASPESRATV